MARYNGYKSWNQWNVSLWLNNDEALYNWMKSEVRSAPDRDTAAARILAVFVEVGMTHTPDGARYNKTAIRAALVGI